jgi:hypothetical protein
MDLNVASEDAPTLEAKLTPACSACERGTAGNAPVIPPLSPIAPAIKPFASGEAI